MSRQLLTSDLNIYCDATYGNDSNNGLTTATAFKTIQAGVTCLMRNYDGQQYNMFINLAQTSPTNPYTGIAQNSAVVGTTEFFIQGATTANGLPCTEFPVAGTLEAYDLCIFTAWGLQMLGGNGVTCLKADKAGGLDFGNIQFEAATLHGAAYSGGRLNAIAPYVINGGGYQHLQANDFGTVTISEMTINVPNNITFTQCGLSSYQNGLINCYGTTITGSGSVTGPRGQASDFGIVNTGGNANAFPGSSAFANTGNGLIL